MPNLRIIHDNAADRATSLAASTTAGALTASLMQNDFKGQAHRSTGTSVSYTLTWTAGESIGGVALPATNLTADATIRGRLYSDAAGTDLIADSGTIYACPGLDIELWDWTIPLNANAFAFGGVTKSAVWFDAHYFAKRCVIDLVDTFNPAGYIDCARLVAGGYWEPERQCAYGVVVQQMDTTQNSRNDAGDNPSDRGVRYDTLTLDLQAMTEADANRMLQIIRGVGSAANVLLSLRPARGNSVAEQNGMIYGKRANAGVVAEAFLRYSNRLDMGGW